MSEDITTDSYNVNVLEERAAAIKREWRAYHAAGQSRLEHAFAAGHHLVAVQERLGRGLRGWLKDHGLNKTDCYDFMLLARHEESVRTSGHSSVAAALRMLRKSSGSTGKAKAESKPDQASLWKRMSAAERTAFLDDVGVDDFRLAMSFNFYRQIRDLVRVEKVESTPSGKGTALAKTALSHIKAADKADASEAERLSNLNEGVQLPARDPESRRRRSEHRNARNFNGGEEGRLMVCDRNSHRRDQDWIELVGTGCDRNPASRQDKGPTAKEQST
jgi:hypothetical protein